MCWQCSALLFWNRSRDCSVYTTSEYGVLWRTPAQVSLHTWFLFCLFGVEGVKGTAKSSLSLVFSSLSLPEETFYPHTVWCLLLVKPQDMSRFTFRRIEVGRCLDLSRSLSSELFELAYLWNYSYIGCCSIPNCYLVFLWQKMTWKSN